MTKATQPMRPPYITMPTAARAEGEIDLAASPGDGHDEAIVFAQHLARRLLAEHEWSISAFSIDWAGPASGRLYGQMWLEREGASVHFLNGRLYAEDGTVVAACSATAHHATGRSR